MGLDTVVGYVYKSEIWCPACIRKPLGLDETSQRSTEYLLDRMAETLGFDSTDEYAYDSDVPLGNIPPFPKVLFADHISDIVNECDSCNRPLKA